MSANTKIEWADHTFNPWEGCTKVSPGCAHCYAEARNARFGGGTAPNWGKGAPRRRTSVQNWNEPRRWNRAEEVKSNDYIINRRPRVFCASLADWLDDEVPIEWLADLLTLIRETPNLDWLLLTKRPENWDKRVGAACSWMSPLGPYAETKRWLFHWLGGLERENHTPPANVWIGTTVENQAMADKRIPLLLSIPARVQFLSCEPLLGPINLDRIEVACTPDKKSAAKWLICGGESGHEARPMHPEWARSLRNQCAAAGVPFFFKQWGEWAPSDGGKSKGEFHFFRDGQCLENVGKKAAGRLLDGVEHSEFPS